MLIRLQEIVDDRLCYEKVRELRWQEGVTCPHCGSSTYRRHGHHNSTEWRKDAPCVIATTARGVRSTTMT
jgi:hypothetical protein